MPLSYLIFLQNKLEIFNACMKKLQEKNISAAAVKFIIDALLVKM
jgi:hypothetical protein